MNKKKGIIIATIVLLLLVVIGGVTYAFYVYSNTGEISEIVTGQIYMNYEETSTIFLTGVFPETKAQALARTDENGMFEFTITGRNTSDKTLYYEINILEGGVITGATETSTKILPEHVMIYLERDGEVLVDGMTYRDWNNRRIWVETISGNTTENIEHNYKLRMWIDERVTISDTSPFADYTTSEWNDSYTSLQVRVVGNFIEKNTPYNYMANLGIAGFTFWPDTIEEQKANITAVNFVKMKQSEIDTRLASAPIKENLSSIAKSRSVNTSGMVNAWLEIDSADATKYIMYVASEGTTFFPSNCAAMFGEFTGLKSIVFDNVDTSQVTSMYNMFKGCSSLTSLDLSSFDTSQVKSFSNLFHSCRSLMTLDLSGWDTSQVISMSQMFDNCSNLIGLDLSNFDTSKVNEMVYMFHNCSNLTSLDVSNFDTNQVSNMSYMFSGCSNLTSLDLSSFDTSQVTKMERMFYACSSLTSLDVSNFDIKQVTNTSFMFSVCTLLTSLDLSNWDTSQVTTMNGMFSSCGNLTTLDLSSFDTSQVTNMSLMFNGCSNLTTLDLSSFDVGQLTETSHMFNACDNLTTIYANSDWNTGKVTNSTNMFNACNKLVGAVSMTEIKDITMANPTTGYFTVKPTV